MPLGNENDTGVRGEPSFSFGPFRLFPGRRLLLEGDNQIRLGSRALDILVALVERAGRLVPKEELIARVWPNVFVEESNLKIQVSALRRALGDGQRGNRYIITVPGRGYEFVAPVAAQEERRIAAPPSAAKAGSHNLPVALTRMIGRDEALATLVARLSRERLVTIVGPGGIGKTTLALAVAEAMIAAYPDGVWLVDLTPLGDPELVPNTIATMLGFECRSQDPLGELVARLRDKAMLLVLDNCEHVIEASAILAEALLRRAAGVRLLATSREPLRVQGETLHHLAPLAIPPASRNLAAVRALGFPAVQLFVERASAILEDFALSDAEAPIIAELCRRLDGLPLAIEFAASRVDAFGIAGLALPVGDQFRRLSTRRRGSAPRQRTMTATLDWSYGLLADSEQQLFRRLGIFAGGFTVGDAAAVATDAPQGTPIRRSEATDRLADLVAKSLVTADVSGAEPRFRLLETTRAYALEKLTETGEREMLARRHAEYYRDLFERAEAEAEVRPTSEWLADYGRAIDNLRAALDWAFGPGGDVSSGVPLTAAAISLWMRLSLLDECRSRIEQALAALSLGAERDTRQEMKLHAAKGASLMYTRNVTDPEVGAAWTRALQIAERLGDLEYQLQSLWGVWGFHMRSGQHRVALALVQRFCSLAARSADPNDTPVGERMIGESEYLIGNLPGARSALEHMLARYATSNRSRPVRFQLDQRARARAILARVLWLQGFPDQAMRAAEIGADDVRENDHAISLCYDIALGACPIALSIGDLGAADHYVGMLLDRSARHGLSLWQAWGRYYQGMLVIKRGDISTGAQLLRTGLDELGEAKFAVRFVTYLGDVAEALGRAGHMADGLKLIEQALARFDHPEDDWLVSDLLRANGELLLLQGSTRAAAAAADQFVQARDRARRQGALSWELRAGTSFARLLRDQGRSPDAVALLRPIYDRFTEGFGTTDLTNAKAVLDTVE